MQSGAHSRTTSSSNAWCCIIKQATLKDADDAAKLYVGDPRFEKYVVELE